MYEGPPNRARNAARRILIFVLLRAYDLRKLNTLRRKITLGHLADKTSNFPRVPPEADRAFQPIDHQGDGTMHVFMTSTCYLRHQAVNTP